MDALYYVYVSYYYSSTGAFVSTWYMCTQILRTIIRLVAHKHTPHTPHTHIFKYYVRYLPLSSEGPPGRPKHHSCEDRWRSWRSFSPAPRIAAVYLHPSQVEKSGAAVAWRNPPPKKLGRMMNTEYMNTYIRCLLSCYSKESVKRIKQNARQMIR